MRLFAAIMPPREVLDEVSRVVRSVDPPQVAPQPQSRKRRFPGLRPSGGVHASGRDVTTTPRDEPGAPRPATDQLAAVEPGRMYLPLTGFGNVTLGDSVELARVLRDNVAHWPRPRLVLAGAAALEFPGDDSVWVKLDGDVDALNTIGHGVPQAVKRVGYFVDRRQFRPWLSVGTITDTTTAPYLEQLVAALDAFRGKEWTPPGVSLMRWLPDAEHDGFEEMENLPLS